MAKITVTKIEAARRQLQTAIEFWFMDRDAVSAHALARAAYQVLHDRSRKIGQPLFDLARIKPEYRKEIRDALFMPSDFMKHGDAHKKAGKLESITFDTDLTHGFIVYAIMGLGHLKQDLSTEEQAFNLWNLIQKPELFTDAGRDLIENRSDPITIRGLRALPKDEFFKRTIEIIRSGPSAGRW